MFLKRKLRAIVNKGTVEELAAFLDQHPKMIETTFGSYGSDSVLTLALCKHKEDMALLLIERGARLDTYDRSFPNAAYRAAYYGQSAVVKKIARSHPHFLEAPPDEPSVLHYAAALCDAETIQILLDCGMDPLHKGRRGETAYYTAQTAGNAAAAAILRPYNEEARATQRRLSKVAAPAAAGWSLIDAQTVAYARAQDGAGYRLTDIFNFGQRTCVTLYRNLETGVETAVQNSFADLAATPALAEAENQLRRLGGSLPTANHGRILKG